MRFLRNFNDMGNAMQNNLLNDSGSNGRKAVQVQVLLPAPSSLKPSVYAGLRDFLCPKSPKNPSAYNVKIKANYPKIR